MNCPNCQTANPEGARFCFNCGTALPATCSNCGANLLPGARFCSNCGHPVPASASASTTTPPATAPGARPQRQATEEQLQRFIPGELLAKLEAARRTGLMEGERRVVTILFCDVKGSTAAAAGLDPEEWAEIMNGAFEEMIAPIYRYEGTVARLLGDGLLAFFGAPIAHEDDPQRAILAGLDIVAAIRRYAQEVRQRWGIDFDVRVGINTGLVVVGAVGSDLRVEYTALGDAINIASRMEQTAQPGTVQIAEPTYRLVSPLFEFEVIEGLEVKGREEPLTAYRVLRPKAELGRLRGIAGLQAPLIGREAPMAALKAALAEVQKGRGQLVSVTGEAGLGKSRLIAELHQSLTADPDARLQWIEGKSLSYESATPFAPFIDLLRQLFELPADQPDAEQYARLKERLAALFPGRRDEIAPFLATMLDIQPSAEDAERVNYLDPPHLRGLIFGHISSLIERLAAERPLVIFLDDLHWTDPTSLELLQSLLPLTDRSALMIIAAYRPRRQEPSWAFHETAERDFPHRYQMITLQPLGEGEARQLVAMLLEIEELPARVRQTILDKSEGNPFFVEEIIRSLLDGGLVVREDGHWRATREIVNITIPDTLIGVITARLDRLDESVRHILQAASVLGREFAAEILVDITELPDAVEVSLIELQRRGLIRHKGWTPDSTYAFKHVLTQEAAYSSILLSNRRELHRRAAESLISRRPEPLLAQEAASIARHLLEARQPGRAAPYLIEAGERAGRAYATREAIDFFSKALELEDTIDSPTLLRRAYEGLGQALTFANRIPEAQEVYERMLTQGQSRRDCATEISALNKLAALTALRLGDFQTSDQLLTRAERLAQEREEMSGVAETALIRCQMCTAQADFESVVAYMDDVVSIGQKSGTREQIALGLEHITSSLVYLVRFEEAAEKGEKALRLAREIGDREHEAWLLASPLPMIAIRNGDLEGARDLLQEGLQIATRIGASEPHIIGSWMLADLARWQGDYEKALDYARASVEAALPIEQFMPFLVVPPLGTLGSVYLEISKSFTDEIARFHHHALRLLESPPGTLTGGAAWADIGFCALSLGDLVLAGELFQKGLHHETMFMYLERPRLLAGAARLARMQGDLSEATRLIEEAQAFAEEKRMRHMYPLVSLISGEIASARGDVASALSDYERAEVQALELNMRSIVWRARAGAAESLAAAGRSEEAEAKRHAARAMVEEIAALFEDEALRAAYLDGRI